MQIIIALSGRKQAGKNTIAEFIADYYADRLLKKSSLALGASKNPFRNQVMVCSFADTLKDFCVDVLGIAREACYGSDEEKNKPTQYLWENASPFLAWKFGNRNISTNGVPKNFLHENNTEKLREEFYNVGLINCLNWTTKIEATGSKTGPMTARDVMQIIGTDLMRETFGNIWANATILKIKNSKVSLAVISDNRFPSEIQSITNEPQGYVIRLTRSPFGTNDVHPSESALDNYNWDKEKHFVLDNINMTMQEQNEAIVPTLENIFNRHKV